MIGKLQRSLTRMERDRESFCEELHGLAPSELHCRETEKGWSALEVLDHLVRSEKTITTQLSLYRGGKRAVSLKDRLRNSLVRGVMRSPLRVRTPKGAEATLPGAEKPLETLLAEWTVQRQALKLVMALYTREDAKHGTFRHPVGGWTTANGALKFIEAHVVHHRIQVKRTVRRARGKGLADGAAAGVGKAS